ncbi:MAG: DHHA1 domain-containing protein, partial [Candidatus Jordarchaeaceae archaeon]
EYQKIQEKAKELAQKSQKLTTLTTYFTYRYGDRWGRGASKEAMLTLEEKTPIVVSIAIDHQIVKKGTIATKKNLDLTEIYEQLRNEGYSSGGHRTIGGFQTLENKTLEQTLQDLKNALKQIQKQTQRSKSKVP